MSASATRREVRREHSRAANRASILDAARRVAARGDARTLSLRAVAAEAGYAPAALYGYFRNKDELLLALAAEDLSALTRALRASSAGDGRLAEAAMAALTLLEHTETLAAAVSALPAQASEAERIFNGRLIAALTALSEASGKPATSRETQADIVLMAASLAGLALLLRSGRLQALGFSAADMIGALSRRFGI
ncbi:MAG TPA: TetR family transcriptional regulator [Rhizomicrobium sp.]|nr:TetR family transcriptional regulator [Rhizomicrobium sp.]